MAGQKWAKNMKKRDFKVAIIDEEGFNKEVMNILENAEKGIIPEIPVERVYFGDMKTFLRHITPKRLQLLEELHKSGPMRINDIAKILKRNYKNVHEDVSELEIVGLIEKDEQKRVYVPWNEIKTTLKLAA